jgi:hypothetical protein
MDFITVGKYLNLAQADLIAGRLEAAGFNVLRSGVDAALGFDGGVLGVGGIRLQVPEDQVERARALVKDLEATESAE